jgi:UDP-2-acetamido-3-amino-2,3-dideoxy-glucuronate N-acetyltransferase
MIKLINFINKFNQAGKLTFFEIGFKKQIPFEVKRIYYIYDSDHISRGFHAHKNLSQVLIPISGSVEVTLDDGQKKEKVLLDNPGQGLLITDAIWREMHHIKDNTIILVLASEYYDENDYIRNYDEFLKFVNK